MLLSIDPTLGYEEIERMKQQAITLRSVADAKPLQAWLSQFIVECSAKLPSHRCWLEDGKHIVMEAHEDKWKHILLHIEFDYDDAEGEICYACVKRYELKEQEEPHSYNQSPPGLYARYPYLYRVKVSHETWLQLTKLWCDMYQIEKETGF